jgi:putative heme iron utilization protein
MRVPAQTPLNLLHRCATGTLATHLREPAGFPFPTAIPFALDSRHRPVILVSRLAEHTRNLEADSRAGFLVTAGENDDVLNGERLTLVGRFVEMQQDVSAVAQRYMRYHPDAQRYLMLGDFSFRIMEIDRMRYIGGFGSMGWLPGDELDSLAPIPDADEAALLSWCDTRMTNSPSLRVLGIDRYGMDWTDGAVRRRHAFDNPKADVGQLRSALEECIRQIGPS